MLVTTLNGMICQWPRQLIAPYT